MDADGNAYGPFDVLVPGSEAEPFTEEAWFRMHDESGVVTGGALTFTGLTAHLAPIFAYSHGGWLYREDPWDDTSPETTGADPRRDLLVLRRTMTVGEGEDAIPGRVVPLVLRGTPGPSPTDPEHDEDTDERLWSWRVPGGGGTVVTGQADFRRYVDRAGRPLGSTEVASMANRPTSPRRGDRVFSVAQEDEYLYDGTHWRNGLAGNITPPGASAGDWITGLRGSTPGTPSAGVLNLNVGHTFSAPIDRSCIQATPGDTASNLGMVIAAGGGTASAARVLCRRFDGTLISSGSARVNWVVVGYND